MQVTTSRIKSPILSAPTSAVSGIPGPVNPSTPCHTPIPKWRKPGNPDGKLSNNDAEFQLEYIFPSRTVGAVRSTCRSYSFARIAVAASRFPVRIILAVMRTVVAMAERVGSTNVWLFYAPTPSACGVRREASFALHRSRITSSLSAGLTIGRSGLVPSKRSALSAIVTRPTRIAGGRAMQFLQNFSIQKTGALFCTFLRIQKLGFEMRVS